jgi:WD40 repeat protein
VPQEPPAAAGPDDSITQFETAHAQFTRDLRDLHIRCGKPKQAALVAAAEKLVAEKHNEKFRLHAGTLSQVLNGKKTPSHEFLAALIGQLVRARPTVGEYKNLWAQWDNRWQELMRLKDLAEDHRSRRQEAATAVLEQQALAQAEDVLAKAAQEASDLLAEARAQAEEILHDAQERGEQALAAAVMDVEATRAQARQQALDAQHVHEQLQAQLAEDIDQQRRQAQHDAGLLLTRARLTADLLVAEAQYAAADILHEAHQEADLERRDQLLRAIIETESLHTAADQQTPQGRARTAAEDQAPHAKTSDRRRSQEKEAQNILHRAQSEAAAIVARAEQAVEAARQDAYWEASHDARRFVDQAEAEALRQAELTLEAEQVLQQARVMAAAIVARAEHQAQPGRQDASGEANDAAAFLAPAQMQQQFSGLFPISTPPRGHSSGIHWVTFSSDSRLLATCDQYGWVRMWDPATGQPVGEPLTSRTHRYVAFSPHGRLLAAGEEDGRVRLWDPATGQPVGDPFSDPHGLDWPMVFSADGQLLAAGAGYRRVRLWDPATGNPVGEPLSLPGYTRALAFRPDGHLLAAGGRQVSSSGKSEAGRVWLWDPGTQQLVGEWSTGRHMTVDSVAFSPDGRLLATSDGSSRVWLWDSVGRVPVGEPLTHSSGAVSSVAFSPGGGLLATAGVDNQLLADGGGQLTGGGGVGRVWLWDPGTQQLVGELSTGPGTAVRSAAFSPDGRLLAVGCSDGSVWLWNRAASGSSARSAPRDS